MALANAHSIPWSWKFISPFCNPQWNPLWMLTKTTPSCWICPPAACPVSSVRMNAISPTLLLRLVLELHLLYSISINLPDSLLGRKTQGHLYNHNTYKLFTRNYHLKRGPRPTWEFSFSVWRYVSSSSSTQIQRDWLRFTFCFCCFCFALLPSEGTRNETSPLLSGLTLF